MGTLPSDEPSALVSHNTFVTATTQIISRSGSLIRAASGHFGSFGSSNGPFSTSTRLNGVDDETALRWAAIEKLPTYDRLRKAILVRHLADGSHTLLEEIDVTKLGLQHRQQLLDEMLSDTEKDNELLLLKLRDRINKVSIDLPTIEVRFENLTINADVHVGSRALPTLSNFTVNVIQDILEMMHLMPARKHKLTILNDISGIIRPSRMTLLLGPPGSGKTTLLLALAGKLDKSLKVSGTVTYNGHGFHEFVPQKTSAYVSQYNVQTGELTVRETFDFLARVQGVGSRYDMLTELLRREKEAGIKPDPDIDAFMKASAVEGAKTSIVTDYVLKILGLDVCADIFVGNEMRRGISGGQMKRVTAGEMLVGPAKALFMDEISTGLDSSTTFQIVKCLRQSVHVMDGTMLISLLQPAPETFELFDDIILISEGHIVYQGPRESALSFFEHMGFRCPDRKSVADFLQEVISKKDQKQYWADKTRPYDFVPVTEFARAFKSFDIGKQITEELSVPYDKKNSHPASLVTRRYALSQVDLLKASFAKEWLLMKRNAFVYIFSTVQMCIVALLAMSVFNRTKLHHNSIQDGNIYLGSLFFSLIVTMFNGFTEMSLTVSRLPVFYKQRDMLLYPAWVFTLPLWILRVPMSIFQTGFWVAITYYSIGYAPQPSRFFRQYLLLFLLHQMALGLFRFIAGIGRIMVVAATFGTLSLVIIFVCGGFVISKDNIPKWWIWGYWISPLTYLQNAISINEFLAPRWQIPNPDPRINEATIGRAILKFRGMYTDPRWYWIGAGVTFAFMVLFNVLFTIALTYLNPLGKPQAVVSKELLEERRSLKKIKFSAESTTGQVWDVSQSTVPEINGQRRSLDSFVSDPESAVETTGKGMILPFKPHTIAFDNIRYYVDMPLEMKAHGFKEDRLKLLEDISGAFRPGILTALVGVSGAGKTTLMDVLAGRKTGGYIEGTISISGYPKRQETFTRISGYCEQNDIHSPNVTIYESLLYSAWLRLPNNVDSKTRTMFVEEVMELVELVPLKDALVGLPGINGLSTEQRKRLTIAVELVANPSIIFMDEPTSGLDARAAAIVMRTVRNTVDTGRTVVCTIHQPSIDIFESFDELLLLKQGGQVIYAGPLGHQSYKLIEYFEKIPGVPKIKESYNPATWMLEISTQSAETRLGVDFAAIYRESELFKQNKVLVKELSSPALGSEDLHFSTKYPRTFLMQTVACLWKQYKSYWRNPYYMVVRFFFTSASALLFGSIYWRRGLKTGTIQDIFNVIGGMYAATLFIGVNNCSSVQPVVGVERIVYYRERGAGMYSSLPYAIAQAAIEVPYTFVQAVVYSVLVFSMYHFEWAAGKFLWFIFFVFFSFLTFTFYGMMCVSLTANHPFASILASAFYAVWNLFSGFIVPRTAIPIWWRWYYWASPVAWTVYGLIASQLGDLNNSTVEVPGVGEEIVSQYIRNYFGFEYDFLGVVAVMHVIFPALFMFVFAFSIKNFIFQRR